jgi:catechol 2,3-dioxygenase
VQIHSAAAGGAAGPAAASGPNGTGHEEATIMKLRWSHAVLYVRDIDAMIAFYRDVLGFEVSDRGPLDAGNPAIEVVFLSQSPSDHHQIAFASVRGPGESTTLDHIAFRVDSLADVQDMAGRLRSDGRATDINGVNHGNAWSVYFKDPEGNGIEVFCDSPWNVRQPQLRPCDLTMSEQELSRATQRQFAEEPGFEPIDAFYAKRKDRFGE